MRARFRSIRYTPSPELLEDRRLLAEILQPHRHGRPPNPPAGQIAPGFRGEIRAEAAAWQAGAPIRLARTEVAAAVVAGEIVVIGGLLQDGSSSSRVDAYSLGTGSWHRLPDLPVGVNHAAAASDGRRLYVLGGYGGPIGGATLLRSAFVLQRGQWRPLPDLPEARAAAGAAIVRGRIYVVGGVGPQGLATGGLAYSLRSGRWSAVPGPTPREHLAVTAVGGRVYALGGRLAGLDTNQGLLESYAPRARRWRSLPPVPQPRSGTGAAALHGQIVSVGGEALDGTIAGVYTFNVARRRWRQLADLPTPRHGLGVVAANGRIYAIAGGPRPGLFVSDANESLPLR
jgi:N-acetylneuraminic acid mutarotase